MEFSRRLTNGSTARPMVITVGSTPPDEDAPSDPGYYELTASTTKSPFLPVKTGNTGDRSGVASSLTLTVEDLAGSISGGNALIHPIVCTAQL